MLTEWLCRRQILWMFGHEAGSKREKKQTVAKAVAIGACSDELAAIGFQCRFATYQAADLARSGEHRARSAVRNIRAVRQVENWIAGELESVFMPIDWLPAGKFLTRIELLQERSNAHEAGILV